MPREQVMATAARLAAAGRLDEAVALARHHLGDAAERPLHLLQAGAAISSGDEEGWLKHLNAYLAPYGIASLALSPVPSPATGERGASLLDRLRTAPVVPCTGGPKVSVIMAARNAANTIEAAARSVLGQSWRNLELLILDDASADETWARIQSLAAADPRIRPRRLAINVGPYVCRNLALGAATGEWLTCHDADDWAHPQWLERHLGALRAAGAQAGTAFMLRMTPGGGFENVIAATGPLSPDGFRRRSFAACLFHLPTFRRSLGAWDCVRLAGDHEMILRAQHLLGTGYRDLDRFASLSLDLPGSLTNHPEHGTRTAEGLAPSRRAYAQAANAWHAATPARELRLDFPSRVRPFPAPAALVVPATAITSVLAAPHPEGVPLAKMSPSMPTPAALPKKRPIAVPVPHPPALAEWAFANHAFDPGWYRTAFPDVALLQMEPETHFRRYGALMGRAPNPALAADPEQLEALRLAPPPAGHELLTAHRIALSGHHIRALHYARRHLPPELAHTLHVLQANRALAEGNRAGWLEHLNSYLDHFGVAPLRLLGEPGENVLAQFVTAPLPAVTDGPMVSVIMPAFNAEKTIAYAIRSILNQTWRNLELLIVDDASTDSTWQIIQSFAASDPRIRAFRNAVNVGPYVSKNVAVTQATGEWITGADADDWSHPERLQRQMLFCWQEKKPICMAHWLRISENGELTRLYRLSEFFHDGACRNSFISLLIKSQYFHDILGSWDCVRFAADSEMYRRIERILGLPMPQLPVVTMFGLDHPASLTNHPTTGFSQESGASPARKEYRLNCQQFHETMTPDRWCMPFPAYTRPFGAPTDMLVSGAVLREIVDSYESTGVHVQEEIITDATSITTLSFATGNGQSTLDEVMYLKNAGHSVQLVHCPFDDHLGRSISSIYDSLSDYVSNWSRVGRVNTGVLICRHPTTLTSRSFAHVLPKICADTTFVVVNNAHTRATGERVYDQAEFFSAVTKINTKRLVLCPISPAIRAELQDYMDSSGEQIALSALDWTPTFDPDLYTHPPKTRMVAPWAIGRHGRDHVEKWHEDPVELRRAYPAGAEFRVSILGGAEKAREHLGGLPNGWQVHEFGKIAPGDYLQGLDAFVFFPHSGRIEAFGRTIVEAMLAARPVLLPRSFESTFDDLPIYLSPAQVANAVRALAADDAGRIAYLTEVQKIAIARYSSPVIARRLAGTGLNLPGADMPVPELSPAALRFKRRIEAVQP